MDKYHFVLKLWNCWLGCHNLTVELHSFTIFSRAYRRPLDFPHFQISIDKKKIATMTTDLSDDEFGDITTANHNKIAEKMQKVC